MCQKSLKWSLYLLLIGALGLQAGCSDDSQPVDAAVADTGGDTPVDAGPDASLESLTFLVFQPGLYGAADKPLENATVAFDMPGGKRVEKQTGADGKVTFDGIDWSAGTATATAHLDGYDMQSECNLSPARIADLPSSSFEDGAVKIPLYELAPAAPPSVTVSGTAKNLADPTHRYVVNVGGSKVGSEWSGTANETFSVTVPKGADFALQGWELTGPSEVLPSGQGLTIKIYRVMHKAITAITQDMTGVELDFTADEVPMQTADVNIGLASRADSPLRAGYPICYICNSASRYCNGWYSTIEIEPANDQVKALLFWTTPTWVNKVYSYWYVTNYVTGDISIAYEAGYPKAGAISTPLLDVARWKTPAGTTKPSPLYSKMEWELFDQGVSTVVYVYKGTKVIWAVFLGKDATSVTLPKPPSTVDSASYLGQQLQARVFAYVPSEPDTGFNWARYSASQTRYLKP